MTQPWDEILTALEREIITRGGYGKPRGLGARPCLLIIDCQHNHIGADRPILDQIDQWPAGAGDAGWRIVRNIVPILAGCREHGRPIVFTRYCYTQQGAQFDAFAKKRGKDLSAFVDGAPGTEIVEPLTPLDDELVLAKAHASAFYGTTLLSYLISLRVDSLLLTGVSTSGCVRATAVDGASLGYAVAVVADCVTDRIALSHKASLLDLWMKYTDVIDSAEVIKYLSEAVRISV